MSNRSLSVIALAAMFPVLGYAQSLPGQRGVNRVVSPVADAGIVVDGKLDDPAWQHAAKITGFLRITETTEAEQQTSVWFMHDAEALYFAAVVNDTSIAAVDDRPRDKQTWEDDCVELFM